MLVLILPSDVWDPVALVDASQWSKSAARVDIGYPLSRPGHLIRSRSSLSDPPPLSLPSSPAHWAEISHFSCVRHFYLISINQIISLTTSRALQSREIRPPFSFSPSCFQELLFNCQIYYCRLCVQLAFCATQLILLARLSCFCLPLLVRQGGSGAQARAVRVPAL